MENLEITNQPSMHVFGAWEEVGENSCSPGKMEDVEST